MTREEIKNKIVSHFKEMLPLLENPATRPQIQMGFLNTLFGENTKDLPVWKKGEILSTSREIIQEFINMGALYPGQFGQVHGSDFYPWLTITEYGKEIFSQEDWLPYDPDGYIKALKEKVPEIDDVTLIYISEAVATFNRRELLSATITIGVASENLMLLLIEAYTDWIKNATRKSMFYKKVEERFISTQYKEFKKEFITDLMSLPKEFRSDWETYLDGVFNFIRLNRNDAGHPTGKQFNVKVVYASLQIFAEYAQFIIKIIQHFKSTNL